MPRIRLTKADVFVVNQYANRRWVQPNLPPSNCATGEFDQNWPNIPHRHHRHRQILFFCVIKGGGGGLSRGGGGTKSTPRRAIRAAGVSELASKCSHFGGEETPNTAVPDPNPTPLTNRLMVNGRVDSGGRPKEKLYHLIVPGLGQKMENPQDV